MSSLHIIKSAMEYCIKQVEESEVQILDGELDSEEYNATQLAAFNKVLDEVNSHLEEADKMKRFIEAMKDLMS